MTHHTIALIESNYLAMHPPSRYTFIKHHSQKRPVIRIICPSLTAISLDPVKDRNPTFVTYFGNNIQPQTREPPRSS